MLCRYAAFQIHLLILPFQVQLCVSWKCIFEKTFTVQNFKLSFSRKHKPMRNRGSIECPRQCMHRNEYDWQAYQCKLYFLITTKFTQISEQQFIEFHLEVNLKFKSLKVFLHGGGISHATIYTS